MPFIGNLISTIVTFLFGWFKSALPFLAGYLGASGSQFLISLGFGVTVFSGFNYATSLLIESMVASMSGLPTAFIQLLGLMWVDKALNLLLSAGVTLLTLKGLRGGVMMRQTWWKPGQKSGDIEL